MNDARIRRRRRSAVALVSLATVGAACSSFSAADSPSAATPDGDAASPAVSDAAVDDALGLDAGFDANGCSVVFSEPFASPDLPPVGWTLVPSRTNGSLAVEAALPDGAAPLGGDALLATAELHDEVVTADNVSIRRTDPVTQPLAAVVLAYDVLVTRAEYATYAHFGCQLRIETNGGASTERIIPRTKDHSSVAFEVEATGYVDGGASGVAVVRALPVGVWAHVGSAIVIDASGSSRGILSIRAQGDPVASTASITFPAPPGVIDAITVECGIPFADTGPGTFEVAIDDVALQICPR